MGWGGTQGLLGSPTIHQTQPSWVQGRQVLGKSAGIGNVQGGITSWGKGRRTGLTGLARMGIYKIVMPVWLRNVCQVCWNSCPNSSRHALGCPCLVGGKGNGSVGGWELGIGICRHSPCPETGYLEHHLSIRQVEGYNWVYSKQMARFSKLSCLKGWEGTQGRWHAYTRLPLLLPSSSQNWAVGKLGYGNVHALELVGVWKKNQLVRIGNNVQESGKGNQHARCW